MRNNVFGAVALAAAVLTSSVAFAGDHGPSFEERERAQQATFQHTATFGYQASNNYVRPDGFTIVHVTHLNKGDAARVASKATPANVQSVQASIDASTASELRARGVQLNNVIGTSKAFNGTTVYYVR